jgi:hypothetical protein
MSSAQSSSEDKIVGVFVLLFGVVVFVVTAAVTMLEVQTSEAFILHSSQVSLLPNWSLINQIPELIMGTLSPIMVKPTLYGWGGELLYAAFFVLWQVMRRAMKKTHPFVGKVFFVGQFVILAFQFWSNLQFGTADFWGDFWGQLGFAFILLLFVLGGWWVGLECLIVAKDRLI